jgi:Na+/H+ antiporter NhaC
VPFETADRSPQRLQTGFFLGFGSHVTTQYPFVLVGFLIICSLCVLYWRGESRFIYLESVSRHICGNS